MSNNMNNSDNGDNNGDNASADKALWDALDALDLDDTSTEQSPDELMALAAHIDQLSDFSEYQNLETPTDLDDPNTTPHRADPMASAAFVSAASDVLAADGAKVPQSDPTLVALKNRAYTLVAGRAQAVASLGLRGWIATVVAAVSLSFASFSTVAALSPFEPTKSLTASSYELSESSLYGTQSLWDLESTD